MELFSHEKSSIQKIRHENGKKYEDLIINLEFNKVMDDTEQIKRNTRFTEYIRWIKIQDNMLRQKSNIEWNKEGDFIAQNAPSDLLNRKEAAMRYFHNLFIEKEKNPNFGVLKHIDREENPLTLYNFDL